MKERRREREGEKETEREKELICLNNINVIRLRETSRWPFILLKSNNFFLSLQFRSYNKFKMRHNNLEKLRRRQFILWFFFPSPSLIKTKRLQAIRQVERYRSLDYAYTCYWSVIEMSRWERKRKREKEEKKRKIA